MNMLSNISSQCALYSNAAGSYRFPLYVYIEGEAPTSRIYNQLFFQELLRKQPGSREDFIRLHNETNESFLSTEKENMRNTQTLMSLYSKNKATRKIIRLLRIEMLYILGSKPQLDVPTSYTSGATTTCRTGNTAAHRWLKPEITGDLLEFIQEHYTGLDYVFPVKTVNIENFARGAQVPKTVDSNRMILIPPVCNVTFERMLGQEIGQRLKYRGIDIKQAADKHKILAYYASMLGVLNTDDLKNASNTILTELVRLVLPPSWYSALDAARCKSYILSWLDQDGRENNITTHHMTMFMGNGCGFCFELETALFAAIIKIGCKLSGLQTSDDYRDVHVYGDDMIYPTTATKAVRGILSLCGLTTHVNKSFSEGFFRESCGGDYLNGRNVRPVHLRSPLSSDREKVIFLNQITRMRKLNSDRYTPEVHMIYCEVLSSFTSQSNIFFGPEYMGDSVLQCPPFVDLPTFRFNRYGVARMKIWSTAPEKVECIESFSYELDPDVFMTLAANGHLRDLGSISMNLVTGQSTLGAPGYNRNGFPFVASPGSAFTDIVSKSLYFERPGLVDETDPVNSVFKILMLGRASSFPLNNSNIFRDRADACSMMAYRLSRRIAALRGKHLVKDVNLDDTLLPVMSYLESIV